MGRLKRPHTGNGPPGISRLLQHQRLAGPAADQPRGLPQRQHRCLSGLPHTRTRARHGAHRRTTTKLALKFAERAEFPRKKSTRRNRHPQNAAAVPIRTRVPLDAVDEGLGHAGRAHRGTEPAHDPDRRSRTNISGEDGEHRGCRGHNAQPSAAAGLEACTPNRSVWAPRTTIHRRKGSDLGTVSPTSPGCRMAP